MGFKRSRVQIPPARPLETKAGKGFAGAGGFRSEIQSIHAVNTHPGRRERAGHGAVVSALCGSYAPAMAPGGFALRRLAKAARNFQPLNFFWAERAKRDAARGMRMPAGAGSEFQSAVCDGRRRGAGERRSGIGRNLCAPHAAPCDRPRFDPVPARLSQPHKFVRGILSWEPNAETRPAEFQHNFRKKDAPHTEPLSRKKLPSFAPRKAQNS